MHSYLLPCLNFGPVVIQRLVARIAEPDLDKPLSENRFSPREIVAHLADWEPILRGRIRAAVEAPGSTIQVYDEGRMAIDHDYANTDIQEQSRLLRREREKTADYARSLNIEELKRTVTHPERGLMSAEDLVGMLLGHDMYHVEQLSEYLPGETG
ncbi:MAG: DinB family protein [Fimbriimonadales bacterium]